MIKKCIMNVDSAFKSQINGNNVGKCATNFLTNLKEFLRNTDVNLQANSIALQDEDIRNYFFNGDGDFKVFLSHSSQDREIVYKFASYLNSEGINTFVDSMVWDNYKDLLKEFGYNLDEQERLNLVAHLHIILASSLTYMIDKCECFIFLASEKSISNGSYTFSPWIYHELLTASIIQTRGIALEESKFKVQYSLPFIGNIKTIGIPDIVKWIRQ